MRESNTSPSPQHAISRQLLARRPVCAREHGGRRRGRWPAADVGRRARARPAWHDDVEGLLCFWWCACRRTTGVSRPLSRRRDRAAAADEEPTRKPVAGFMYVVARTQYKEDSRPSRVCVRAAEPGKRQRAQRRKSRERRPVLFSSHVVCADVARGGGGPTHRARSVHCTPFRNAVRNH